MTAQVKAYVWYDIGTHQTSRNFIDPHIFNAVVEIRLIAVTGCMDVILDAQGTLLHVEPWAFNKCAK